MATAATPKQVLTEIPKHVPGLEHVRGDVRVDVGERCLGIIRVDNGNVALVPGPGHADAVVTTSEESALHRLLHGEMNAIVAIIQGNIDLEGDVALASKILYAVQADMFKQRNPQASHGGVAK
jgi:putative sterol carrier protein